MNVWSGKPHPLGATWDGKGVNFAIFSEHAERVELCLFEGPDATRETARIPLPERADCVWHGYLPDTRPGQLYGYRVSGPYDPDTGHRFNPAKVVLDPYAKGIGRTLRWDDAVHGCPVGHPRERSDGRPAGQRALRAAGRGARFRLRLGATTSTPRTPWHETAVYEVHVKGFTARHPDIPERLRGTLPGSGLGRGGPASSGARSDCCRAAPCPPGGQRAGAWSGPA